MKVVKQLAPGDTFGELALLHNAPQSATFAVPAAVEADRCRLWVLGRDAYRMTLFKAAEARRNRYKGFLRGVSCLAPLSDYDILALADACHEDTIPPGGLAYTQGDPAAHRLSVVFKGVASCTLVNAAGDDMEVARLAEGDHFGEYSLSLKTRARDICTSSSQILDCLDSKEKCKDDHSPRLSACLPGCLG